MTEIIITPALFFTIGFVFWVLVTEVGRRSRLKMQMELRTRLLDRLTSAADIVAVLQSNEGALLSGDGETPSWSGFHGRVLRPVQIGLILLFVSAGFGVLAALGSFEAGDVFAALAIMAAFVGAGFVVSALVAWGVGLRSGLIPARDATLEKPPKR